jgi:hypothetical protein
MVLSKATQVPLPVGSVTWGVTVAPALCLVGGVAPKPPHNFFKKLDKTLETYMSNKSKYKQVKINMKPEDDEKLLLVAEKNHKTKADYIRGVLKIEIENAPAPKIEKVYKKTDPFLMYEIKKIGVNLNQIAKHTNIKKRVEREMLSALFRIENDLKKLL